MQVSLSSPLGAKPALTNIQGVPFRCDRVRSREISPPAATLSLRPFYLLAYTLNTKNKLTHIYPPILARGGSPPARRIP